jgi:putative peptidoglycan binding protein
MTEARATRGCRILGDRRLQMNVLAMLAALVAGAGVASAASGAGRSGGGGIGPTTTSTRTTTTTPASTGSNPFRGRGMWIWVLPNVANGGDLPTLIAQAHQYGVGTLMIKSGDGSNAWSQFSPQLVSSLHGAGLRVCAWQYVYGAHPIFEAQVGAAAVRNGADCLLIDAEAEYEQAANNYVAAQRYVGALRTMIGQGFPVALAGFPYMDYHQGFPYSVFLGPGGAQYNVPQMYWTDIGVSVDEVYAHTYTWNGLYQRPISPLGQVYNSPPLRQVRRFRQVSRAYAAPGVSWWDWADATRGDWHAVSQPIGPLTNFTPSAAVAPLGRGDQGDLVIWAQEHLVAAGQRVNVDGVYGATTQTAVRRFQAAHGIQVLGIIGPQTWQALLSYAPARVRWVASGSGQIARPASVGGVLTSPQPKSLPAKRYEIPPSLGAGRPKR